jgi:hypothetical protein
MNMSIEGLPPASSPFFRMDKSEAPKQKPQAAEPVKETPKTNHTDAKVPGQPAVSGAQQPAEQKPKEVINQPLVGEATGMVNRQQTKEKVSHHIAELQAMTDKIKQNNEIHQTRNEIMSMGNSLLEMQQDLSEANSERYARSIDVEGAYSKLSYWDKLDVVSKSQTINRLKDEITNVTIDRANLVNSLKEQVVSGGYQPSGAAILKGMIDEFF